MLKYRQLLQLN